MNNAVEIEIAEAEVTVAGMTATPPTVTLVHEGIDNNRVRRSFAQQVPVRDVNLASRVLSELHQGDRVQVTVINEWRMDGCETYLSDFKKVITSSPDPVVKNGANSIAYNEITEFVIQPEPTAK